MNNSLNITVHQKEVIGYLPNWSRLAGSFCFATTSLFRVVYIIVFHIFAKKPERGRLLANFIDPGIAAIVL